MKKVIIYTISSVFVLGLTGCADMGGYGQKQNVGLVTGGILGGVLGNQVGGGVGRVAATIGGALLGAMVGGSVGKSMDDTDRLKMGQALENSPTGRTTSWTNPDGVRFHMTPTRTYNSEGGRPCREYRTRALISGKWQNAYGTACRRADGNWQIVS